MSFIHIVVSILIIVLLFTVWWYRIYFKYRKYLKKFPVPFQIPLIGLAYRFRNTVDLYSELFKLFEGLGSNYYAMFGPFPVLATADPKVFSLILGSAKHVNKPFIYNIALENSVGGSLLLVNGNEWRRQRKLLNPAFHYSQMNARIHVYNAKSDELIEILSDKIYDESTEIVNTVETCFLMQTYETIFGDDTPPTDVLEFVKAVKCIMEISIERCTRIHEWFKVTNVFTKNYWREKELRRVVFDHVRRLIKKKKSLMESGDILHQDKPILVDILLKQMLTDENINETFIVKQLVLMTAASYDTTAMSICFVMYHLSLFPEIQQKVFEEVFSIVGEDITQPITHRHVNDMVYLDLVIKESMRMKTTIPAFLRKLDEDVDFEGTILPKGLTIALIASVLHFDPEIYPDPEKFIPERFLPGNLMNSNIYSYVPFSGGIRNCIGQKHALLAMKVTLAKILLNYKLVDAKHELVLACGITLRSKTGVKVGFRKRDRL